MGPGDEPGARRRGRLPADSLSMRWHRIFASGVPPAPRWAHTATTYGGCIVVVGGASIAACYNDVHVYCQKLNRWYQIEAFGDPCGLPAPRGGHSACLLGDGLFIFGGNTLTESFGDLWMLDLSPLAKWQGDGCTPDPPRLRWHRLDVAGFEPETCIGHSATRVGTRIILYGGRNFLENVFMKKVVVLDVAAAIPPRALSAVDVYAVSNRTIVSEHTRPVGDAAGAVGVPGAMEEDGGSDTNTGSEPSWETVSEGEVADGTGSDGTHGMSVVDCNPSAESMSVKDAVESVGVTDEAARALRQASFKPGAARLVLTHALPSPRFWRTGHVATLYQHGILIFGGLMHFQTMADAYSNDFFAINFE
eukprot:Rmarinus@m.22596